jgi:hypothetical protein
MLVVVGVLMLDRRARRRFDVLRAHCVGVTTRRASSSRTSASGVSCSPFTWTYTAHVTAANIAITSTCRAHGSECVRVGDEAAPRVLEHPRTLVRTVSRKRHHITHHESHSVQTRVDSGEQRERRCRRNAANHHCQVSAM